MQLDNLAGKSIMKSKNQTETECPQKTRTIIVDSLMRFKRKLLYMECHTYDNLAGKSIMKNKKCSHKRESRTTSRKKLLCMEHHRPRAAS